MKFHPCQLDMVVSKRTSTALKSSIQALVRSTIQRSLYISSSNKYVSLESAPFLLFGQRLDMIPWESSAIRRLSPSEPASRLEKSPSAAMPYADSCAAISSIRSLISKRLVWLPPLRLRHGQWQPCLSTK